MINWEWTESDNKFLYELCEKLRDEVPLAFSRWGDGEWATLTHNHTPIDKDDEDEMASKLSEYITDISAPVDTFIDDGKANVDGNIFYEDLGNRLKDIVSVEQDYYMGYMNTPFTTMWGEPIHDIMKNEYPQTWVNSDILHGLSVRDGLSYMFDLFESIHVVYIGNESLKTLPFINEFIEIPYNNVWVEYENVLDKIKILIDGKQHKTFLFSAGMATNVFVDDLWKYNKNNTYIDVGSVFDPYVGRKSRGYHNTLANVEVFK
tara:strand:+ start:947 stop:1732 length:786 start_codon:yes stop_codon:yes gene_type:complete